MCPTSGNGAAGVERHAAGFPRGVQSARLKATKFFLVQMKSNWRRTNHRAAPLVRVLSRVPGSEDTSNPPPEPNPHTLTPSHPHGCGCGCGCGCGIYLFNYCLFNNTYCNSCKKPGLRTQRHKRLSTRKGKKSALWGRVSQAQWLQGAPACTPCSRPPPVPCHASLAPRYG